MVHIGNEWDDLLKDEFAKAYYQDLRKFLVEEYTHFHVYPEMHDLFNALRYTPYKEARVVLLGQDPYHQKGQAHGLCFSVKKGVSLPPSLKNMYKELHSDLGCTIPTHGELTKWAKQGVLMLNTCLSVREGQANSHTNKGWEILTDKIISLINEKDTPVVFLLWGRNAQSKERLISNPKHLILKCAHPSPLSAFNGFFGCKHFSKTNDFLVKNNLKTIDWQID
ncbi:MAG: uracil-DNA glycosylase [Erysipelotrichia bacterium]|nr:uracil-DNA glycosylase [Erysipelotrichia bacterium]NCC54831.1 uracil-DNA glycosylase [Erysipelotrichia bacterium]